MPNTAEESIHESLKKQTRAHYIVSPVYTQPCQILTFILPWQKPNLCFVLFEFSIMVTILQKQLFRNGVLTIIHISNFRGQIILFGIKFQDST